MNETPEINLYSKENSQSIAKYLEGRKGEKVKTNRVRMAATAENGPRNTEDINRLLEELEKASFIQKSEEYAVEDNYTWKISPFYDQKDAIQYLEDKHFTGRLPHPLGEEFDRKEVGRRRRKILKH